MIPRQLASSDFYKKKLSVSDTSNQCSKSHHHMPRAWGPIISHVHAWEAGRMISHTHAWEVGHMICCQPLHQSVPS